ncbi:acetyl-CoA C-acetyltransferase [Thermoplasma sp.]|uniref:acetyl-CoA C-acetyltransferase n=1 Tax=Thermoplasma sp. TaxID=1973142 RepID=UPI00127A497E|nr:acetyl-CoA C-acetyltransferase [Thermoplasma sp.]KAA8922424.1 MAG: acetyl-CoA C-acetyltransferase [Thermoplasma sp.]
MLDSYVVYYKRSAFSRSRPNDPERDIFNSVRMDVLMASLIKDHVANTGIDPEEINDAIFGCAYQRNENWTYGGRHPLFLAHMPFTIPSMAVDRACASSMNAIAAGSMEIMTGNSDIVLAGGFEHMTHVPRLSNGMCDPLVNDPEYSEYRMKESYSMGLTAEKLASLNNIGRREMDEFALRSHRLASEALKRGFFNEEILPVRVTYEGREVVVDRDQSIRPDTSMEQLSALKPAFKPDGIITAGNSSPLNAGASLVMLASDDAVEKYNLRPMARIVSMGWAAVEPYLMGEGPVPATRKALMHADLKVDDIDYWEINEAFAVVVLNAMKKLGIEEDRVNVHGGAIAIGHPLGATGARIVGTLARILKEKHGRYGAATLCVGGGQGYTIIIENTDHS